MNTITLWSIVYCASVGIILIVIGNMLRKGSDMDKQQDELSKQLQQNK